MSEPQWAYVNWTGSQSVVAITLNGGVSVKYVDLKTAKHIHWSIGRAIRQAERLEKHPERFK